MNRSLFFSFIIFVFSVLPFGANAVSKSESNDKYFKRFQEVFEKIEKDYVKEPNKQELIDSAIEGMLAGLDPHSSFFADEDLEHFLSDTKGEFGGIGVEITFEMGAIKVISPIDDLAAHKAGIKSGDYIVKINDELVSNLGFNKSLVELRGKPGTKVKVTVIREGESKPLEFDLTREIVRTNVVKTNIEDNIAYLRVSTFSEKATSELKKAVSKLMEENKGKIKGMILDLRNNPGGLLDQSVGISDYFLDNQLIVSIKGRKPSSEVVYKATKTADKAPNLPMVVLINGGSASCSEIVAGALQDNKRALIVGTKSYGKGSVQQLFPIDSRSAYKLTYALYYTPKGKSIQAEGITPDILIEQAKVEYPSKEKDIFKFSESSFKNHLKNDQSKDKDDLSKQQESKISDKKDVDEKNPGDNNLNDKGSGDKNLDNKKDALEKKGSDKKIDGKTSNSKNESTNSGMYQLDFQYARAVDLLKGLIIMDIKDEGKK